MPQSKLILIFTLSFFLSIVASISMIWHQQSTFVSFAQASNTVDSSSTSLTTIPNPSSQSVTSSFDAMLKAILIISQVAVLGVTFNHLILKRTLLHPLSKKSIDEENTQKTNLDSNIKISNRFTILTLTCCISIIVFSTGVILLQSYELTQNLDLNVMTAFSILQSASVGQVWLLRIITSLIIIGVIVFYHFLLRRQNNRFSVSGLNNLNHNGYTILDKVFLAIILALGSANLFSNSMVSHSNSLSSFSEIAVSIDWIHFMAVSVWIGGLFYLSTIFLRPVFDLTKRVNQLDYKKNFVKYDSKNLLSIESTTRALGYFSYIAIVALNVIGITGLYLGYIHLQNIESVVFMSYGQILILKIALAFPMIFIGRYNQNCINNYAKQFFSIATSDAVKTNTRDGKRIDNNNRIDDLNKVDDYKSINFFKRINKSIKIESILGLSILVVASFLSVTSPPSLGITNNLSIQGLTMSDNDGTAANADSFTIFTSNLAFLYLVIIISVIILILSIISFKKNQKQIKESSALSTNTNFIGGQGKVDD
jgi:putative copper export protein